MLGFFTKYKLKLKTLKTEFFGTVFTRIVMYNKFHATLTNLTILLTPDIFNNSLSLTFSCFIITFSLSKCN